MFDVAIDILGYIVALGRGIFDAITLPISDFLSQYDSSFSSFLLGLLEFVGLDEFIADYSFGAMFLGTGALTILVILFINLFI